MVAGREAGDRRGGCADDGVSVSAVARRHGIAPSLLFRWRRDFAEAARVVIPAFIPLALPAPAEATDRDRCRRLCATAESRCGFIEIDLAGGRRLRVDGTVDTGVLKRVIDALEGG